MRYRFIDPHEKVWPNTLMCLVLKLSCSGYVEWRDRLATDWQRANDALDREIKAVFDAHRERCGSPRITDELNERGIACSEHRVARRMQAQGLRAVQRKKLKVTTDSSHDNPVAEGLSATKNWCATRRCISRSG